MDAAQPRSPQAKDDPATLPQASTWTHQKSGTQHQGEGDTDQPKADDEKSASEKISTSPGLQPKAATWVCPTCGANDEGGNHHTFLSNGKRCENCPKIEDKGDEEKNEENEEKKDKADEESSEPGDGLRGEPLTGKRSGMLQARCICGMHSDASVRKLRTPKTPNRTSPLSSADDWSTPQILKQTGTDQTDRKQTGNKNRETGRSATGIKTRGRSILPLVTTIWMI